MEMLRKGRGAGMRLMNLFTKGMLTGLFTLVLLLFMVTVLLVPKDAMAAAITSAGSGNWNSTTANAPWPGGTVPVAGDTVTIASGHTITVPAGYAAACTSITFTANTVATAINLADATSSLSVSGAISMPRPGTTGTSTINIGAGTFSAASVSLGGTTTSATRISRLLISTGTATISGNITSAGFSSQIAFSGAGTLNAGGTFLSGSTGTFTASTGTVNYNGAAQTVGAYTYNNLIFTGSGAKTMATGTVVNNILSIAPTGSATASLNAGVNLTVSRLTLGGLGRVNGTWGSTSSTATNTNNTYFAATTGRLTVANDTRTDSSISSSPTGSAITYPAQLSASTLSGGTGNPAGGTFSWTAPATILDAGTTTAPVTYTPADPTSYKPSSGTGNIMVNKATPTLTVNNSPVTYDGTAKSATVTSVVPGSVSNILTDGAASQTNAGTYPVTADFTPTDTTNYNSLSAASAGDFVINKADQTIGAITFTPDLLAVNGTTTASATATSGLTVGFSSDTPAVCTVSGSTVTGVSVGTCTIRAIQAGGANYNAAPDVTQGIEVIASTNLTLTLTTAGAGGGTVVSAPGNISCTRDNGVESGTCSDDTFVNPTDVTLSAAPDWKSEVVWTGGCSATGNSCGPFTMIANTGVTATFNHKQSVMMPGPAYYATVQDAYNACTVSTPLKLRNQTFNENLVFDLAIDVTLDGGCDASWTPQAGVMTEVIGSVTIAAGSVTVSGLSII